MNNRQLKFVCCLLAVFGIFSFVGMHVALYQRDDARKSSKDEALAQLCMSFMADQEATRRNRGHLHD